VCNLAKDKGILPNFFHDKLIVEPGLLANLTLYVFIRSWKIKLKVNPEYQVYSPFQRQWSSMINADVDKYLAEAESPSANSPSVKGPSLFQKLFASEIPSHIEGFRCSDKGHMATVWPAGTDAVREVSWTLQRGYHTLYARKQRCCAVFSTQSPGILIWAWLILSRKAQRLPKTEAGRWSTMETETAQIGIQQVVSAMAVINNTQQPLSRCGCYLCEKMRSCYAWTSREKEGAS
jgi:hypothetical protein